MSHTAVHLRVALSLIGSRSTYTRLILDVVTSQVKGDWDLSGSSACLGLSDAALEVLTSQCSWICIHQQEIAAYTHESCCLVLDQPRQAAPGANGQLGGAEGRARMTTHPPAKPRKALRGGSSLDLDSMVSSEFEEARPPRLSLPA